MLRRFKNVYHWLSALTAAVYYRFPARRLTVIGVTGTDGKTTTASLIYHILSTVGKPSALISSVSARICGGDFDTGFHVTTPNPWQLQRLLRRIVSARSDYLVLETTSHGFDQHRLLGIRFQVGVLTNITHEHLDYHGDFTRYIRAKAKLFRHCRHAVLNSADQSFTPIKRLLPAAASLHTYSVSATPPSLLECVKTRFPEPFNWSNALAAATAVSLLGVSPDALCLALKTFPGVKGRMEAIPNRHGITAIVDFAHTPNALEQSLTALRSALRSPRQKLIAVFGSAGLRDAAKRPLMGAVASRLADIVVLTAEDPRTETVSHIIKQIQQGAISASRIYIEPDRQQAINLAICSLARPGDTVAVFGKGHEQSMCFGTIEYPWSDHEAIKTALKKRRRSA